MTKVIVLNSGGLDSTTCVGLAVKEFGKENVMTVSILYGQKHSKEMFDTTLMEISEYEELCKDTGDPNHVISEAISVITEINHECFLNNSYL